MSRTASPSYLYLKPTVLLENTKVEREAAYYDNGNYNKSLSLCMIDKCIIVNL